MIEQHNVSPRRGRRPFNLFQFSLPHQRRRIRLRPSLNQSSRHLSPCAAHQLFKLLQRSFKVQIMGIGTGHSRLSSNPATLTRIKIAHWNSSRFTCSLRRRAQPSPLAGKLHHHQHSALRTGASSALDGSSLSCRHQAPSHCLLSRTRQFAVGSLQQPSLVTMRACSILRTGRAGLEGWTPGRPPDRVCYLGRGSRCAPARPLTTVDIACFKNQLLLLLFSSNTEYLFDGADLPSVNFIPAYQVDGNRALVLSDPVQERVLNVLCRLLIPWGRSPHFGGQLLPHSLKKSRPAPSTSVLGISKSSWYMRCKLVNNTSIYAIFQPRFRKYI